jgi:hypothetical protein
MYYLVLVIISNPHREVIQAEKVKPNIVHEKGASQLEVGWQSRLCSFIAVVEIS